MGVTTPFATAESLPQGEPLQCDPEPDPEDDGAAVAAFTEFITFLAPPPAAEPSTEAKRGRSLFRRLNCHKCHTDRYRTRAHPIRALNNRRVRSYTDLLMHDMGPGLADGIGSHPSEGSEFRTPPLWGVHYTAPYLHDGRAATLEQAISAHGGEATAARQRFMALSPVDRAKVIAFLNSL
jgi:CxxC motif-containing protein (DUF1111 family)